MPKKVLVVDDDPDQVELLRVRLEALGFGVTAAGSVKEGLEKIQTEQPDLVFLDVTLPDENGFQLLRRLKNDLPVGIKKIPVVMLTGRERLEETSAQAGASGYLVKPFEFSKLKEILAKVFV